MLLRNVAIISLCAILETTRAQSFEVTEAEVMVRILHLRCTVCHGKRKREGDLDLRTRASLLAGGKSGPAIVLGKPDESLLIRRVVAGEMPPKDRKTQTEHRTRPLNSSEMETLRRWIARGAPQGTDSLEVGTGPDPSRERRRPRVLGVPAARDSTDTRSRPTGSSAYSHRRVFARSAG